MLFTCHVVVEWKDGNELGTSSKEVQGGPFGAKTLFARVEDSVSMGLHAIAVVWMRESSTHSPGVAASTRRMLFKSMPRPLTIALP